MSDHKEIYLIRHGETDFNAQGIVQGRGVDASLNETGREQAKAFYDRYRNMSFDLVYTSSLKRTRETVKEFLIKGFPHEVRPQIDEISWGIYEGQYSSPDMKIDYYGIITSWIDGHLDKRIDGGESPVDVQKRIEPFIDELRDREFRKALVCTHGRTMRIMLCTMLEKDLTKMDEFDHSNLTLYKLHLFANGSFEVEVKNSTEHLDLSEI